MWSFTSYACKVASSTLLVCLSSGLVQIIQGNMWKYEALSLTEHLCVCGRYGPRLGGGGGDRRQEASVRHLGEDGEPGQPDGQHGRERQDPGPRGHLPDPEGARLHLRVPRGDLRKGHQRAGGQDPNALLAGPRAAQPAHHAAAQNHRPVLAGGGGARPGAVAQQAEAKADPQREQQLGHHEGPPPLQPEDVVSARGLRGGRGASHGGGW